MFPQGTVVRYVASPKEPVLAVVQRPSPHGEQYRSVAVKPLIAVRATSPPPPPTETPVQPAKVVPQGSCSPLCMHSFSHVFCSLRTLRIQLLHWPGTRPHKTDPLPPQWQHMLWLWTARKRLQNGDPNVGL